MASESPRSILQRLINSRDRDFAPLIPFVLGFTTSVNDPDDTRVELPESTPDPDDNSVNRPSPNRDLSLLNSLILAFPTSGTDPNETRVESPGSEPDPDENSGNRPSPNESTQLGRRSRDLSLLSSLMLGFRTPGTDPNGTRVESPESTPDPEENSANHPSPNESTQLGRRRSRDLSLLNALMLGFTTSITDPNETRVESPESTPNPDESPRRGTMTLVIMGGGQTKSGQPPAAKSAVEAMPRVEITEDNENERGECVICLEEMSVGSVMKKMPCQHGFHENCIDKWLGIHGSCPVCRYKMPVDEEEESQKSEERENGQRVNREFWVRISFGGGRRRGSRSSGSDRDDSGDGDGDQTVENESDHMES